MRHDSDGHEFFAVIATVHHQGVGQSFNDRALRLSESFGSISTGRMGDVHGTILLLVSQYSAAQVRGALSPSNLHVITRKDPGQSEFCIVPASSGSRGEERLVILRTSMGSPHLDLRE